MFISASANLLTSDYWANMFTKDFANMFTCYLANMFTSDLANMFTNDLANMFTSDLTNMFTSDVANTFTSTSANIFTSDYWANMFTSDLANIFTSELEKCKIMIWPTCSLLKLTVEYVGLAPGIRHLIPSLITTRCWFFKRNQVS